jgi:arginase
MDGHGVVRTDDPAGALAGGDVFVHLDVDILDPTVMPGQLYPAPGGLDTTQLRDLLADVAARARIVGAEITCFSTPELSDVLAQAVAPLLESPAP